MIKNALTVDVEDYFQVSAFETKIARSQWGQFESRVEKNIQRILKMLDDANVKATFFTLGWIAKRHPAIVRAIVEEGHELSSHGYQHERVSSLSPKEFFDDVDKAKQMLEALSGVEVKGYRAPSFSIRKSNALWAFECLARAGYRYSSSIYPIVHDHYGIPDAPRFSHLTEPGVIEIPISTLRLVRKNFPASGGGYFRLLPYSFSHWIFSKVNAWEGQPVVFYFHPWEIDPDQPKVSGITRRSQFRHYVNLDAMEQKLIRLLKNFQWGRMDEIFLNRSMTGHLYPQVSTAPAIALGA